MDAKDLEYELGFTQTFGTPVEKGLANAIVAVQVDHLDTYGVFKAKDKKVRGRVKAVEDALDQLIPSHNTNVDLIESLIERLNALEEHLAHKALVPMPSEKPNVLENAVREINSIIFGDHAGAYGKINIGTLRQLNKEGLVSLSVQQGLGL